MLIRIWQSFVNTLGIFLGKFSIFINPSSISCASPRSSWASGSRRWALWPGLRSSHVYLPGRGAGVRLCFLAPAPSHENDLVLRSVFLPLPKDSTLCCGPHSCPTRLPFFISIPVVGCGISRLRKPSSPHSQASGTLEGGLPSPRLYFLSSHFPVEVFSCWSQGTFVARSSGLCWSARSSSHSQGGILVPGLQDYLNANHPPPNRPD